MLSNKKVLDGGDDKVIICNECYFGALMTTINLGTTKVTRSVINLPLKLEYITLKCQAYNN